MQTSRGTIALAFSGGLDTSYCVPRLTDADWSVHTVYVDTGGSSAAERLAIGEQARRTGAVQHHEIDAREQVS
jgi:argininosuccinate synthase